MRYLDLISKVRGYVDFSKQGESTQQLEELGFEEIGSGYYSVVYEHPETPGKVWKVSGYPLCEENHGIEIDPWVAYAYACADMPHHQDSMYPHVYHIEEVYTGVYLAVVEELQHHGESGVDDRAHDEAVQDYDNELHAVMYRMADGMEVDCMEWELAPVLQRADYYMEELFGYSISDCGPDVHVQNVMWRGGIPVLNDPLA